jgi:hypothetical protein
MPFAYLVAMFWKSSLLSFQKAITLREHKLVLRRLTHQCFRLTSSGQVHDTVLLQLRRHHFQEIVLITFGISDVGLMTFLGPLTKAFPVATIPPQVVEILSVALIRPRLEWPR